MFLHLRLPVLNDIIDLRYNIGFGNAPNDFRLPPLHTAGLSRQFTSGRLIFCKQIHGGSTHVQKNRRRSSCAHYAAELFACDTPGANGGEDSLPSQSPTLLPSAADTAQPTPTDSAIEYKKFSTKPFSRAATVSRAVLHDDDRISISANELVYIDDFAVLKLTAENKSADDLLVSDVSIYVNDCLVEVDFRHKFAAGKTEDFSLYMPILDMMLYGIREISSIDIEFRIAAASGEKYFTELAHLSAASAQPQEPGAYDYSGYIAGDIERFQ